MEIRSQHSGQTRPSLDGARVLILGGTGSLGQRLCRRLLANDLGTPETIVIFSRDEAKQHFMRLEFEHLGASTDEVIYRDRSNRLQFAIGDVRNLADLMRSVGRADVIFHAAALKQVPTCEYFGAAAVDTNIYGAINLCRAIRETGAASRVVVGISTDKACKPVNLMGMTKAIQERILIQANLDGANCDFVNVRYGNVMASRGSAIPYFIEMVRRDKPIPITDARMTRFLMTLDQSVDLIFNAYRAGRRGETFLPMVPSALMTDVAAAVAGDPSYPTTTTGIRPGEKLHEILISEEELPRTTMFGQNFVIRPILPELRAGDSDGAPLPFEGEYSSANSPLPYDDVRALLEAHQLTAATAPETGEIYR
jgi:UDP-glucose 4-epimerase